MAGDTADLIAYGFYLWVAVSGAALLFWVTRNRWKEHKQRSVEPSVEERPSPPLIDLTGSEFVRPPQPPKPPWIASLDRFSDGLVQDPEDQEPQIEIRAEDVASALESDVNVGEELDIQLTDEIAPAVRSDPPAAARIDERADAEAALPDPSHILEDGSGVTPDPGQTQAREVTAIDLTALDLNDTDPANVDPTTPDPTTSDPTTPDPTTPDLTSADPENEHERSGNLYEALAGIRLPAGLIPQIVTGEDGDKQVVLQTNSTSMRLASAALAAELERLGYVLVPTAANGMVGHRLRDRDLDVVTPGDTTSDTIVVTTPPVAAGEPVQISVAVEGIEPSPAYVSQAGAEQSGSDSMGSQ